MGITVFDQGAGMTKEDIDSVCQTFNIKNVDHSKGIGIGLSTTKTLIEAMSGEIEI
jgi:K+-sensing histidine kinase KdpD